MIFNNDNLFNSETLKNKVATRVKNISSHSIYSSKQCNFKAYQIYELFKPIRSIYR